MTPRRLRVSCPARHLASPVMTTPRVAAKYSKLTASSRSVPLSCERLRLTGSYARQNSLGATRSIGDTSDRDTRNEALGDDLPSLFRQFAADWNLTPDTSVAKVSSSGSSAEGNHVRLRGYLGPRSDLSKSLSFADLYTIYPQKARIQLVALKQSVDQLRSIDAHAPVYVSGTIKVKQKPKSTGVPSENQSTNTPEQVYQGDSEFERNLQGMFVPQVAANSELEIHIDDIVAFNAFNTTAGMATNRKFGPDQRHLQLRSDDGLQRALWFRSHFLNHLKRTLHGRSFLEVETPLLFKSTSEGAREFLVPTRNEGMAYALPQSPQQYKQILMASGVTRYFQHAKCFRDEDSRKDRQPEFSQLDLEVAFSKGSKVMRIVQQGIATATEKLLPRETTEKLTLKKRPDRFPEERMHLYSFCSMNFEEALRRYGSDKPDLRVPGQINQVDVNHDLQSKLTSLRQPAIEAIGMPMGSMHQDPDQTRRLVDKFFSSPEGEEYQSNPHGAPGIFIVDPQKPLQGLSVLGHDGAAIASAQFDSNSLSAGDLIVLQARPKVVYTDSTPLGNLRLALQGAGEAAGLLPPRIPAGWKYAWITNRPLFEPESVDPVTGAPKGIRAAHHPFTSPCNKTEISKLIDAVNRRKSQPDDEHIFSVLGDAYDLVLNGAEVGGGSRRIHTADVQEYMLREALQMPEQKVRQFDHLLKVLRCGCPPHAGFALGIDRLIATMLGRQSIRDVMAFPKVAGGMDPMVGSPARMTDEQLETYHLSLRPPK